MRDDDKDFHADEGGAITFVNIVYLMLCVLIVVFTGNVAHIIDDKSELQVGADAVAYSTSLVHARGLNAITAGNHTIGELCSFVVVHEALGGEWLDENKRAEDQPSDAAMDIDDNLVGSLNRANSDLDEWSDLADQAGAWIIAYEIIRQQEGVFAGATILASKVEIKKHLVYVYKTKVLARALQAIPITKPIGQALELAMDVIEVKLLQEYLMLNGVQNAASSVVGLKMLIRDQLMPEVKNYTNRVVEETQEFAKQTAELVGAEFGYQGFAFSTPSMLPVHIDPHAKSYSPIFEPSISAPTASNDSVRSGIDRDQINKITQLARATFPWVTYHRKPIWDTLSSALFTFSKAGHFYKHYSDGYSKRITNDQQLYNDMGLYVLKNYPGPDKGFALWTEDGKLANELFSVMGIVSDREPTVTGAPFVFKQHHATGRIAFAQALVYNANLQQRNSLKIDLTYKRISPNMQPEVGLDTLNWSKRVTELVARTDAGGAPSSEFPDIYLNWQAKLVPATKERIQAMKGGRLPAALTTVLQKLMDDTPSTLLSR